MTLSDTPMALDELPRDLLDRVMGALRAYEPAAVAIVVTGSYAAGTASLHSDLDLTVLTAVSPNGHYRTWFEPRAPLPLHISAGAAMLTDRAASADEPADWALGFPTYEVAQFLWTTEAAKAVLGDPPITRRPAASPELEDFVECATKVRRTAERGDTLGARWHAHDLAAYAPRLLRPLNPERRVADRRDALRAALDLSVAPPGYREDLLACFGLTSLSDEAIVEAALRLAHSLLAFLRERAPDIDVQPFLARYLADGTLERYLG